MEVQQMPYARITACILVEEQDSAVVQESLQSLLDSIVIDGRPVFDSEITCTTICEVPGADEIRRELEPS